MNHFFKLVWNEARQCLTVVSERARSSGKSVNASRSKNKRSRRRYSRLQTVIAAALTGIPTAALFAGPLPVDGTVTHGAASISQSATSMTITQSTGKLAIDWQSFSIGQGNKVTFVQPSSNAIAFNRVTGNDVSAIQGVLEANGKIFLSNPNGVVFSKDAQVSTGSLVATTLQMSNQDLADGRYRLQGSSDKSVTNQGSLTAHGGDGKGGTVSLIAAKIINEGSIRAERGTVALAAGNKVTLDLGGPVKVQIEEGALNALIEQGGAIRADGGTVIMAARGATNLMASAINHTGVTEARALLADEHGMIELSAGSKGVAQIGGTLDVSSASGKGGHIEITGDVITLMKNSRLMATGDLGGGTVLVGGDWQGTGTLQQARKVTMEQGALMNASAISRGDGGKVVLWSDVRDGSSLTDVAGEITVIGGSFAGSGGMVETSGHDLIVNGSVNAGRGGSWLLDPVDITISSTGSGSVPSGGGTFNTAGTVSNTSISTALSNGNNVTISTSNTGASSGNITINANILSTSATANSLTLNANASIDIAANVSIKSTGSGALNLTLSPNLSGSGGYIWMRGNNAIATNGGSVLLGSETVRATGMATGNNKGIELDNSVNITTSGGDISMFAKGLNGTSSSGAGILILSGAVINSGNGKILLDGISGSQTQTGGGGQGITFFAATGSSIGTFSSGSANNIFITSTSSNTTADWQTNVTFASPITIKSLTADNFNTAAGLTIQQSGGGANGSLDVYAPNGHVKWIADGGNFAINARAPVRVNANGAVFSWGSKTNAFNPNVSTTPFEINVNTDLRNGATLVGDMSFIPTRSNVSLSNGGFSWIPNATQFESWFFARNLYLGDSRTTSVILNDTVNLPNTSLFLNAPTVFSGSVSWSVNEISSTSTISNNSNVTINATKIDFSGAVSGTGSFTFRPISASSSIRIGDSASGSMHVTRATLQNLNMTGASSSVTIGAANGTGDIAFSDSNLLSWIGDTRLISQSGNILLNGSASVNGNLNLTTSGNINLGGSISTVGNQSYSGAITLMRDLNLSASNGTISTSSAIDLSGGALNINQSGNSILSGILTGGGGLTKSGSGQLTLTGNNTYTGTTTISDGAIVVGDGQANGTIAATANIVNDGLLIFDRNDNVMLAKIISGSGSVKQNGSGNLTLSANNTYTGTTTIANGKLIIGDGSTNGSIAATASIVSDGALIFNRSDSIIIDKLISGSGTVTQDGTGNLIFAANHTYTGTTTINSGSLSIGDGTTHGAIAASGGIVDNGTLIFNRSDDISINNLISGSGNVTQAGSGSLALTAANTYAGATRITSGQIALNSSSALGSLTSDTIIDGGSLVLSGNLLFAKPLSINGTGNGGNGALVSQSGDNSLTGNITLLGPSTITSASGSSLSLGGAVNGSFLLTAAGSGDYTFGTVGNAIPLAGLNVTGAGNVNFSGSFASSANITVVATGDININGTLSATGSTVKLNTTTAVNENGSGSISASALALLGAGSMHTLDSATNNVGTLAADVGTLRYTNANALTIGIVNPTGITATGPVAISTVSGNLTVSQNITTADTTSSALILNAGSGTSAGTSSGGDIVLSGSPTLNVGTGGRATFFSGSVNGSTSIASDVGSGSLRFRYGSDQSTSNFTTVLGSGKYLIYREQPTVNITALDKSRTFDGIPWVPDSGFSCTTCFNGDINSVSYGGTAPGAVSAGTYTISPSAANLTALGYLIGTLTDGTLTITAVPPVPVTPVTSTAADGGFSSVGAIQNFNLARSNLFDTKSEKIWGKSPDTRLSYVEVNDLNQEIPDQYVGSIVPPATRSANSAALSSGSMENGAVVPDQSLRLNDVVFVRIINGGIREPGSMASAQLRKSGW